MTIELASFDVGPGEEVYKCQNFANPFGEDVEVSAFESHMTGGSHHLLLFYKNGASDGPLTDCSGLEFDATPYGTQLPDDQRRAGGAVGVEIADDHDARTALEVIHEQRGRRPDAVEGTHGQEAAEFQRELVG